MSFAQCSQLGGLRLQFELNLITMFQRLGQLFLHLRQMIDRQFVVLLLPGFSLSELVLQAGKRTAVLHEAAFKLLDLAVFLLQQSIMLPFDMRLRKESAYRKDVLTLTRRNCLQD